MPDKKGIFKLLINEFHNFQLPPLIKRELEIPLFDAKKIITVIGPRRSGKTFYFFQLINKLREKISTQRIVYINFEDERILPLKAKDLGCLIEGYYELYPEEKENIIYFFFDEIQNITDWEVFIRRIFDKEKIKIFITGSSSKLLSTEIATSLRGRTLSFQITPLSFKEFLRFKAINLPPNYEYSNMRFQIRRALEEFITLGGYPEVVLEKDFKKEILKEYFETMIARDLIERFSIRNKILLKDLLKFLLSNVSNPFSINSYYRNISQYLHISKETLLEFISYIQETEIIYLIPIYSYSLKKQQANPKKIYSVDNGLRNAVAFKFSKDEGRLVENIVFQELKRRKFEIFYWINKKEIDFIIKDDKDNLSAINVSYGSEIEKKDFDSLLELKKTMKKVKNLIIINKEEEKKIRKVVFIPLWKWLLK
jgi:predicted AAA+ superfamily ATPase